MSHRSTLAAPRALRALSLLCLLWFQGQRAFLAAGEAPAPKEAAKITYDDHIVPLLRRRCFGCHNQNRRKGGLALSSYGQFMEGGSSGSVIEPGEPDESRLWLLVSHQERPFMPPRRERLPDEQLEVIRKWIEGGALENTGSVAKLPKKPRMDLKIESGPAIRPEGPPPLPRGLTLEPAVRPKMANAIVALASNPWAPVAALGNPRQVLLYNTATLELAGVLPFPEGVPHVLRFSRNGSLLLAGGGRGADSGRVVLWSATTGERIIEVGDEYDAVLAADISGDQSMIALGGAGKLVKIYSTADGSLLHSIKKHTDWVLALEFSPDSALLGSGDRSGGLLVWESWTAREFHNLRGHGGAVTDVSWRGDSNVLASSSEDGTLRLWDMENGRQIKRWRAHAGGALSVEFAQDGRIASAGRDRTARLWDGNGKQIRAFEAFDDIALKAVLQNDGQRVIAGDWSGEVRVWNAADGKRLGDLLANPPTLVERLEASGTDLQERTDAFERASSAAEQAKARTAKLGADLAAAQSAAEKARARLEGVRRQFSGAEKTAGEARNGLLSALEDAGDNEKRIASARDSGKTDEMKSAEADLLAAWKSVLARASSLQESAAGWIATREAMRTAEKESERARKDAERLAAAIGPAREEEARREAARLKAQEELSLAKARVARWKAASELHRGLEDLRAKSAEVDKLESAAAELEAEEAKAAAALAKETEAAGEGTRAAREASARAEAAAREMLKRATDVSGQLSKSLAKADENAEIQEGEAERFAAIVAAIDAVEKLAGSLAAAARDAKSSWEDARKKAEEAASRTAQARAAVAERERVLRAATEKLAAHRKTLADLRAAVEKTRQAVEKWTSAFESSGAQAEPPASSAK